ncbi:MAG: hypothetical protein WDM85_03425 [Caulobacteraceae bacterium]
MAAITEVSAELIGSRAAGDELEEAEAMAASLEPDERADLAEMRRTWIHTSAVPKGTAGGQEPGRRRRWQAVWRTAKPNNDWAAFEPGFTETAGADPRGRRRPRPKVLGTTLYGALLDEFDPGVGEAMIDPIFAELAAILPGLIAEVRERQAAWPAPIPFGETPVEKQAALSHKLAVAVGHDPDAFRIDAAPHPVLGAAQPGRRALHHPLRRRQSALRHRRHPARGGACHVRVQPAPRLRFSRPGGNARGMTMHESQSLSLERMAGRSREFLGWLAPLLAAEYGGDPARWSLSNVLNEWRRLDDGFIRVEADELSYRCT